MRESFREISDLCRANRLRSASNDNEEKDKNNKKKKNVAVEKRIVHTLLHCSQVVLQSKDIQSKNLQEFRNRAVPFQGNYISIKRKPIERERERATRATFPRGLDD